MSMSESSDLSNKEKKDLPQGTATIPQGTATVPQGTATAPQGTATAFENHDSNVAHQGAQAEIIIQDGKVLKLYRVGASFNAEVLPLVKRLNGKGYLVDLYDFGTMDYHGEQRQFELMEYCPAGAVSACDLKGNSEVILKIAVKTALALDACHGIGFIHKDVKPANILIHNKQTWDCLLCDFGIADVLDHGKVATAQSRTPIYAAPEVYDRTVTIGNKTYSELTPAADFYSLGMTILCLWMGESAFRSKESVMAIQKVHDGIVVPTDMPDPLNTITRGLLVKDPSHRWELEQIQAYLRGESVEVYDEKGKDGLEIVFNSSKNQVAHSPEELAAYMVGDMDLAIKYLYSGKISKWLEHNPELQIEMENIVEKDFPKDQQMGLLAAIHALNPFYDLNLCCDIHASDYAMTGSTLGNKLNEAYHHYFTLGDAGLIDTNIAKSFARNNDHDYFPWFLDHKGNRFAQQRKWFNFCMSDNGKNKKKAGPKDKSYLQQMAMMKTIAGFGAKPVYRLSRTGMALTTLDDFRAAPKEELRYDLKHDKGLRGWLAVQCHENPFIDMKVKYTYEKLLEQYLSLIGSVDESDESYCRFIQARDEAKNFTSGADNKEKSVWRASLIQKLLAGGLAAVPLTALLVYIIVSLVNNPVHDISGIKIWPFLVLGLVVAGAAYFLLDSDGCAVPIIAGAVVAIGIFLIIRLVVWILVWIFALHVVAALVFFIIKTLFTFSPHRPKGQTKMTPGFEELTLEPLHYAFSSEKHFDSSLNGAVEGANVELWALDVRKRWKMVGIFIGVAVVFCLLGLLI